MSYSDVTLVGNICNDLRLRAAGDKRVVDFRVACTRRTQVDGEWKDADTVFIGVTAWERLAVNVAASLQKGDRVLVQGRLRDDSWTDESGVRRERVSISARFVSPDLTKLPAPVQRFAVDPTPDARTTESSLEADEGTGEMWEDLPVDPVPDDARELEEETAAV